MRRQPENARDRKISRRRRHRRQCHAGRPAQPVWSRPLRHHARSAGQDARPATVPGHRPARRREHGDRHRKLHAAVRADGHAPVAGRQRQHLAGIVIAEIAAPQRQG
ncbi:unnamed protein product [Rhizophagus irregularis]|nr:unnamed protein product [Rhizophagus irregularis]